MKLDLKTLQPFQTAPRLIALYGTTIDYWLQRPVLLGAERPGRGPSYDLIEAVLCSSAFPCVFSPRRESDLFPGTGLPTSLFCDGGMFDNLPFLPATEILAKVQSSRLNDQRRSHTPADQRKISIDALEKRCQHPDLFIAGSLDVNLQTQPHIDNHLDDILRIWKRGSALQNNVKIKSFEHLLLGLDEQLRLIVDHARKNPLVKLSLDLIDQVVNAAVLPVYPSDADHLNGTFAFCASTGLKQYRLMDSISNGCFQTLRAFVDPCSSSSVHGDCPDSALERSLKALRISNKLPQIIWNAEKEQQKGMCKYFSASVDRQKWPRVEIGDQPKSFVCPFFEAATTAKASSATKKNKERKDLRKRAKQLRRIYRRCISDPVHLGIHARKETSMAEPSQQPPATHDAIAAN